MAYKLTPSEELALEVLAARTRLGESVWTFKTRHQKALDSLASKGLVFTTHGVVEKTVRAGLTEEGRAAVLSANYTAPKSGTQGLGSSLFAARSVAGMTQTEAAAALDSTPATISRYESGDRTPSIANLVGLAQTYGVTVQELIEGGINASEGAREDSRKARE